MHERLAKLTLFFLLALSGFAGVMALGRPVSAETVLHARMPENGGWSEETITAEVGKPLKLRLTSDDVLHSFAIGQMDLPPVDLLPGKWVETEITFDRPGRYTYYCTRWCGRNHWRMRGTIEVRAADGSPAPAPAAKKPLYLELGLDIDAMHMAENVPARIPSAARGAEFAARLPDYALDRAAYERTSPSELWARLRAEPALADLTGAQVWDLVAYAWGQQTSPAALAQAAALYATNCAACHGPEGKGDGVMVEGLPAFDHTAGQMSLSRPPDLTDPATALGASPALLEGKLLRGGMGTGMPYWGPIFTEEQMDALVAYLYTFAIETKEYVILNHTATGKDAQSKKFHSFSVSSVPLWFHPPGKDFDEHTP